MIGGLGGLSSGARVVGARVVAARVVGASASLAALLAAAFTLALGAPAGAASAQARPDASGGAPAGAGDAEQGGDEYAEEAASPRGQRSAAGGGGRGEAGRDEGGDDGREGGDGADGEDADGPSSAGAGAEAPDDPALRTLTFDAAPSDPPDTYRLVLPPLLIERRGDVRTRAVFPLYFERDAPGDHTLLAGLYWRRRARDLRQDVAFPFFWWLRGDASSTVIVPPFWYRDARDGFDLGLAPLFFTGRSGDATYTVIPPLLAAAWADRDRAFTFVGPFWRVRSGTTVKTGLFPFAWFFDADSDFTGLVPPFFFRFEDRDARTALTIVPPVYHRTTPDSAYWGVAGLLHHYHDAEASSTTVPPALFHYRRERDGDFTLVTPLFGYTRDDGTHTLVTPLYQRHRGDTWLDATAPFFFAWGDDRQRSRHYLVPPVLYHAEDPGSSTTVVFPFYARFAERGRFTTTLTPLFGHWRSHTRDAAGTWVFPNIQVSHHGATSTFNIHPLVYHTRAPQRRHLVIAPLYWDFEDARADTRATVVFPLFWRFRSGDTVSQLALNAYWHEGKREGASFWEFHFFPFFAFGSDRPGDHWWNVLYGLLGYRRSGSYARMQLLWVPFQVDGPSGPSAPPPARGGASGASGGGGSGFLEAQ